MAKSSDKAPWAKVGADDVETICRSLGAEYVAVWCRLSICAAKTQSSTVEVSRRQIGFDSGLSRATVRRHLDGLEREGFIAVERHRDDSRGDRPNSYVIMRGPYATPGQNPATPRGQNLTTPVYHGEGAFREPRSQECLSTDKQEHTPRPQGGEVALPFGEDFRKVWEDWKVHRREKRQRLTPQTVQKQLAALAAMTEAEAIAVVERSITAGWVGLFPDRSRPGTAPRRQEIVEERPDGVLKVRLS